MFRGRRCLGLSSSLLPEGSTTKTPLSRIIRSKAPQAQLTHLLRPTAFYIFTEIWEVCWRNTPTRILHMLLHQPLRKAEHGSPQTDGCTGSTVGQKPPLPHLLSFFLNTMPRFSIHWPSPTYETPKPTQHLILYLPSWLAFQYQHIPTDELGKVLTIAKSVIYILKPW